MNGDTGSQDVIRPENAKDPILILIVAFFLGGIAYFVLGQWQKGVAGLCVWLFLIVLSIVTCGVGALVAIPIGVVIVLDAYMQAAALKAGNAIGQWTFFSNHL